jgi:hypothetical protein
MSDMQIVDLSTLPRRLKRPRYDANEAPALPSIRRCCTQRCEYIPYIRLIGLASPSGVYVRRLSQEVVAL